MTTPPRWLQALRRPLGWIEIPNIAMIFVTLQGLGFLMVSYDPSWAYRLALIPSAVRHGEIWRLVTFLSLPLSMSPIWVLFTLWFLYFILNSIEAVWGAFQTTFYFLMSILVTIALAFALELPVTNVSDFETTLFLAAAGLFPEMEIRLFFMIPVKMKWLGWLSLAFLAWRFLGESRAGRAYLLGIYSNYLVFFGPSLVSSVRQAARRREFQRKMRG